MKIYGARIDFSAGHLCERAIRALTRLYLEVPALTRLYLEVPALTRLYLEVWLLAKPGWSA